MTRGDGKGAVLDGAALDRWERAGRDLALRLIDMFLERAAARGDACVLRDGNFAAVAAGAHTLKSSAGNLGARRLQGACERLEIAAERGLGAEVAGLVREVDAALALTVEALRRAREERRAWTG